MVQLLRSDRSASTWPCSVVGRTFIDQYVAQHLRAGGVAYDGLRANSFRATVRDELLKP